MTEPTPVTPTNLDETLRREIQEAYLNLGTVLRRAGELEAALDTFRKAIDRDPSVPMPYLALGSALNEAEKFAEAEQVLQQALEHASDTDVQTLAAIHSNLGIALQKQKKYAEAVEAFRQAVDLTPTARLHTSPGESS